MSDTTNHLIGFAALTLGLPEAKLRKLVNRGVIDVPRVGQYRVFPADRLDEYRRVLEQAGHVPPASPAAGH